MCCILCIVKLMNFFCFIIIKMLFYLSQWFSVKNIGKRSIVALRISVSQIRPNPFKFSAPILREIGIDLLCSCVTETVNVGLNAKNQYASNYLEHDLLPDPQRKHCIRSCIKKIFKMSWQNLLAPVELLFEKQLAASFLYPVTVTISRSLLSA